MDQLGEFQRYLIEEVVEDWREGHLSRREMVRRTAYLTGGAASAATVLLTLGCAPAAPPTPSPKPVVPPPTAPAAAAPTLAAPTPAPASAATKPAAATAPPAAATKPSAAAPASTSTPASASAASTTTPASASSAPTAAPAAATKPAAASPAAAPKPAGAPPQPSPSGPRSPLSVKPDDAAIDARAVEFAGPAGKVFGYLARPRAAGNYAGVIVIHENRGLVPHIEDVTRRAAKEGFVALAVDLLSRHGGTEKVTDPAQAGAFLGQAKPEDMTADLSAGVKFLLGEKDVKQDRAGVFGFCYGGGYAWRLAVSDKAIKAAAPFYGIAPPLEMVQNTNAAILGIYAENDQRINQTIPALEEALKKAGKIYEIKIYPGVSHAFHNDTGPNWNEAAATDAWKTMIAWFKKYLA